MRAHRGEITWLPIVFVIFAFMIPAFHTMMSFTYDQTEYKASPSRDGLFFCRRRPDASRYLIDDIRRLSKFLRRARLDFAHDACFCFYHISFICPRTPFSLLDEYAGCPFA